MPYYCTVPQCTSLAGKVKDVSFHQFPKNKTLADQWNYILKRSKPYTKYSKVCSLHFKPEDFTYSRVGDPLTQKGSWKTLSKDAIPSRNLPDHRIKRPMAPNQVSPRNDSSIMTHQQLSVAVTSYFNSMIATNMGILTQTQRAGAPISSYMPKDMRISKYLGCDECQKYFKDPDVYALHMRNHVKQESSENDTDMIEMEISNKVIDTSSPKNDSRNSEQDIHSSVSDIHKSNKVTRSSVSNVRNSKNVERCSVSNIRNSKKFNRCSVIDVHNSKNVTRSYVNAVRDSNNYIRSSGSEVCDSKNNILSSVSDIRSSENSSRDSENSSELKHLMEEKMTEEFLIKNLILERKTFTDNSESENSRSSIFFSEKSALDCKNNSAVSIR